MYNCFLILLGITASDGTGNSAAIYPDDYTTQEALVTFHGDEQQKAAVFNINNDGEIEGAETFTLSMSKVSGFGEVLYPSVVTVTIQEQNGMSSGYFS